LLKINLLFFSNIIQRRMRENKNLLNKLNDAEDEVDDIAPARPFLLTMPVAKFDEKINCN
jgi:hypothetical protein